MHQRNLFEAANESITASEARRREAKRRPCDVPRERTAPAVDVQVCRDTNLETEAGATRFERWKVFHKWNRSVYVLFCRFAADARRSGIRDHFGARMIGERIRWYTTVETTDMQFKVNDHFWPYYARLLAGMNPGEYGDFFEFRDARFDATTDEIVAFHRSLVGS